jgi:hypothetical protein
VICCGTEPRPGRDQDAAAEKSSQTQHRICVIVEELDKFIGTW